MPNKQEKQSVIAVSTPAAPPPDDTRAVILPAVVHFALDVVDRGQVTAFGALHDARSELRLAVDGSLELANRAASAVVRLAHKLVERVDVLAAESLGGAERVLSSTVSSARASAIAATERLAHARTARVVAQA